MPGTRPSREMSLSLARSTATSETVRWVLTRCALSYPRNCETSRMYVDSSNVQAEVVDARSVVGSRYGTSSASARQSPASRGGSGYTVVGAGFRRRRRNLDTFLSLVL